MRPYTSVVIAHVFDSVNSWKTEGLDQMLLVLDETIIQVVQASVQPSGKETMSLMASNGRAPAQRRSLMSRRRLTPYDGWSVTLA